MQPQRIRHEKSLQDILKVADHLPIPKISELLLSDEWRILQLEELPALEKEERIDHYCQKNVFQTKNSNGDPKYPLISKVIKLTLTISHGNADVERGFSKSKLILTDDKTSMKERILNARLTVYEATKQFKGNVHLIPITKELISKGRNANKSYVTYLENEKRKQEEKAKLEEEDRKRLEEEKENLKKLDRMKKDIKGLEENLKKI